MAKKTKRSRTISIRPQTSPYTSSPTTVSFGVNRQRYYVQDALLQRLENLPDCSPCGFGMAPEMIFTDVDADTGHSLIHFLYAAVYQTLDKTDDENVEVGEKDNVVSQFQKAVRISEASTKYGLPALQQLAQAEMDRWGAKMDLGDAIQAINEDSIARSLDRSIWLQECVSQKVRSAFQLNSEAFLEQDFFGQISSHTLTKILAKSVVSLYSELVSDLQRENMSYRKALPSENKNRPSNGENSYTQQLSSDRPAPPNERSWSECFGTVGVSNNPSTAENLRILVDGQSSVKLNLHPVPNPEPIFDAQSLNAFQAPSTVVQELFNEQGEEQTGRERPAEEGVELLERALEEADRVRILEDETTHQRKVEETSAMGLADAFTGIAADRAEKKDDLGWSAWALETSSVKKKKKKKGATLFSNIPVLAATEVEPERATENSLPDVAPKPVFAADLPSAVKEEDSLGLEWGGIKDKKKKVKRGATFETPPPEPVLGPESGLLEQNAMVEDADNARMTTIVLEIEDCPWRLGHLFEGDGWKMCKPCQAHIRGMASRLQVAGL